MDAKKRFSPSYKLVAQLSQNMNFVMDLTVREFIDLHAESRLVLDRESVIEKIFNQANELAGEKIYYRYSNNKFKWRAIKSIDDIRYCNFKYITNSSYR